MANLIPFKKSNNPIVKADKFLPRMKTLFVDSKKETPTLLDSPLLKIERKVIKIDKLLKDSLLLSKKENEKGRVQKEENKFEEREKELEKKKPKPVAGTKIPSLPGVGILGWIKNFIVQTVFGFLAVRLIDYLPKLLSVLPAIIKVTDFITDIGGKMLDGLVTFVDKAYDLVDNTRKFAKTIGGDGLSQTFDKFTGALGTMLDIAVIAAISAASQGGDGGGGGPGGGRPRKGFDTAGRRVGVDAQKRYAQRFGKDQFLKRFGKRNLVNLGEKGASKSILRFVRPLLKRIPIPVIGALIDFGLSWALGEDPGRAAFRAIGAGLLGWVGTALGGGIGLAGGPLAFVGAALGGVAGGTLGDMAGGALYDLFFGGKKKQGKVAKAAGGGKPSTRGGKLVGGPAKRTLKKKKTPRTLRATPSKLKPGGSVGGEKKIKELYPESKDKTKMNPFEFLKKSYETFSKSTGLGALVALAIKPLMGDRPSYADYKSVGVGINNWMNSSVGSGTLAYAGGGEVRMESIISGEDYSDVIAKSVQDSVAPQVDRTIQDLMKQLMLKKSEPERKPDEQKDQLPTMEDGEDGGGFSTNAGDYKELLDLISSKESSSAGGYNAYNEGGSGGGYTVVGYGGDSRNGPLRRSLVDMTVKEIMDHQRNVNPPIHAAGRYQIIGSTLKALINGNYGPTGVKLTDKFDANTQDKLGIALIKYRLKTGATPENFINEWRGLKFVNREKLQAAINKAQKGRIYLTGNDIATTNLGPGSGEWRFGKTGRVSIAPGWSHAHFDSTNNETLIRDVVPLMKKMASSGLKPELADGTPILSGKENDYYINLAKSGIAQHTHHPGPRIDINMPGFPLVPFPIKYSFNQPGGAGNAAVVPGSGKTQLFHMSKKPDGTAFSGGTGFVSKDGFTLKLHRGEMFKVVDKDSVDLFGRDFIQDIIDIENKPQLIARVPSIIQKLKALSGYMDYEQPYGEPEIVYVPIEVPVPMPMGGGGSSMIVGGGGDNYVNSNMEQTLAQIG